MQKELMQESKHLEQTYLVDNCIQFFYLGRYIAGYTIRKT